MDKLNNRKHKFELITAKKIVSITFYSVKN